MEKKIKAVFFDLDGTLLPMDNDDFINGYFRLLTKAMAPLGYEPQPLIDAVWQGTAAMVKNDGKCRNEELFWTAFGETMGADKIKDKDTFDAFYRCEFDGLKASGHISTTAREIVDFLREKNIPAVVATNPIFPLVAIDRRLRWAGFLPDDFAFITTYENSRYCKPNPLYYKALLETMSLSAEEVLMVGNDADDDYRACREAGIDCFLITEYLLNRKNADLTGIPQGSFEDLFSYLKEVID